MTDLDPDAIVHDDEDVARALTALAECALALGHSPSIGDYRDWRDQQTDLVEYPSAGYISDHCGSWNAAKERLGLETAPGGAQKYDPDGEDIDWRWDDLDEAEGRDLDDLAMSAWFCASLLARACL